MEIRPMEPRDLAACTALYNEYIENTTITFEERPLSTAEFSARAEAIAAVYPYLVAEEDGRILGYAYLDRYSERTAYRFTADVSIYLKDGLQGRGVGPRLMAELERLGRAQEMHSLVSIITGENTRSMRFHERNGFVRTGELREAGYKFGRWLDVVFYQKTL